MRALRSLLYVLRIMTHLCDAVCFSGSLRRTLAIYDRATKMIPPNDKFEVFCVYIKVVKQRFGALRTRGLYQEAVNCLPVTHLVDICIHYSNMERSLGEIGRARAILVHASQYGSPGGNDSSSPGEIDLWTHWHTFEVAHGNEDTFRDMLRIRRSVQTQ